MTNNAESVVAGGCHCGAIRFEARVAVPIDILRCNCSMCRMQGFEHIIVKDTDFRLRQGHETLAEYVFNTKQAKHWFCSQCGVKSFYKPRSHPNGISINARCVDSLEGISHRFSDFDGENWEANVQAIRD